MFSTDSIISRNLLSNKCSFYFCAIHLLPAEEGEFLLYYVKIHGPRVNITNENWKQLQALDFANTFHKVISKYREMEVFAALKYYLTGISIQSFESLYEYYPSWMKNKITTIYGISDCAKK